MIKVVAASAFLLMFALQLIGAVSPGDEIKLLETVKQAYVKHDAEALIAVTCWDRVSDKMKDNAKERYAKEVALKAVGFALTAPDPTLPDLEWKDEQGVAHRSNLPVTKQLKITFAAGSTLKLKRGEVKVKDVVYPIGEKEGRLYLLQPAPVK